MKQKQKKRAMRKRKPEQSREEVAELDAKRAALRTRISKLMQEAVQYHQRQDFPAAIRRYREVLRLHPVNVGALNNLGLLRKSMGEPRVAEEILRMAVNLEPRNPEFHYNLANTLRDDNRLLDAITEYQVALKLAPQNFKALLNLGDSYRILGNYDMAAKQFEKASQLEPDDMDLQMNMANLYMEMGDGQRASTMYQSIIQHKPDDARLYSNCGTAFKQIGDLTKAAQFYRKAVEIDPKMVGAIYSAVNMEKTLPDDPWFELLNNHKQDPRIPLNEKIGLHFALGKMYADIGAYDESFANYRDGNALRNQQSGRINRRFVPKNHTQMVNAVIESYPPERLQNIRTPGALGDDEYTPILIVGMPRSGTTLTEQILASHPLVRGAGELPDLARLASEIDNREIEAAERLPYPQNIQLLDEARSIKLASVYLARLRELCPDVPHVVDKMPGNFSYLGFFVNMFPAAKIIDCRRDPIDNCLSCYLQNFSRGHEYSNDLEHMVYAYREYERLMEYWNNNLPVKIYRSQYEDMVENNEESIRKLLEYCGLEWNDAVLEFYKTPRNIQTASVVQVRQPLYKTSINRWKRYEKHLKLLIEEFSANK